MKRLIALAVVVAVVLAGCVASAEENEDVSQGADLPYGVKRFHDDGMNATCWTNAQAYSSPFCLPDWFIRGELP